jgi:acyl carrier protein
VEGLITRRWRRRRGALARLTDRHGVTLRLAAYHILFRSKSLTDAEIITILVEVMREAFLKPDLQFEPNTQLRDIFGIDSVQFVTLILTLEERFAVMLPEDKVDQLTSVQSLFDLIKTTVSQ